MGIIFDSSILIAAERKRFDLSRFLSVHSGELFFITSITASELLHGCARASDAGIRERRIKFVEGVLQDYAVLPFDLVEAREHAQLWVGLEIKGTLIGERDLLIAAITKATGHSLATLNHREFIRIMNLSLMDVGDFVSL